jgi:hypothetical protein
MDFVVNFMNKSNNIQDTEITIDLTFLAAAFFFISFHIIDPYSSLLINLSAGVIGSAITIWGVENLRKKSYEEKISPANTIADEEIRYLRNLLVCYISNVLGITVRGYLGNRDVSEKEVEKSVDSIIAELSESNFLTLFSGLEIDQWKKIESNLILIKFDLSEKIQLYQNIFSPEIFSQLIVINKVFKDFYNSFGLFSFLLTTPEKDWPENKKGPSRNRSLRDFHIRVLSEKMEIYFCEVRSLSSLLAE